MKGIQKLPEQHQLSSLFPIVDHWNPFGHDGRRLSAVDPRSAFTTASPTITTTSGVSSTTTGALPGSNIGSFSAVMMKPTDLFRDQVNALWSCFKDWNECEQTLVLYSLLKGVSGTQAKFLCLVLEQALTESDLQHVEREANDPDFVRSLSHESKDEALAQVLSHLPLLQPSSTEAKAEYLKLIPEILTYTQEKGVLLEEAHQLYTYLVIHPALSCEEQLPRTKWIHQFEDQPSSFSSSSSYPTSLASEQLVSPFLKPSPYAPQAPDTSPSRGLLGTGGCNDWYTGGVIGDGGLLAGPSSFHQPLTTTMSAPPAVNVTGPSAEDGPHGKGKRNSFLEEKSGMKDVPSWLKSLRLHKYTGLFETLDYNEMMNLSEKQLEDMDVTKGARNKIMLSIHKLKERQQVLRNLEKDIMSTGSAKNLRNALNDIKNIMNTPIQAMKELTKCSSSSSKQQQEEGCVSSNPAGVVGDMRPDSSLSPADSEQSSLPVQEGDLPGQITRFMGKMCTQLLMSPRPHEETITQYLQLLDKCYNHEAFTAAQKSKLLSWRKNCQKFSPNPYARKSSIDKQPRGWSHYSGGFGEHTSGTTTGVTIGARRPVSRQTYSSIGQPHPHAMLSMGTLGSSQVYRQSPGGSMYLHHRQSIGGNPHSLVQRTKSAPNRRSSQPAPPTFSPQHPPLTRVETPLHSLGEPDITDRLERLCRSVTEHALEDDAEHNGDMVRH